MNAFDRINESIRNGESSLVNLLSAVAPWGAPLAPAFMSFAGMQAHLGYPFWVALIIAGVIEILGLATVHTTLQFWRHNRRYSTEYRKMPTILAGSMFLFYLCVVLVVNVMMEWPYPWTFTPIVVRALLSLLAVPAAVIMAIRTQHTELLREIRETRAAKAELSGKKRKDSVSTELSGKFPKSSGNWRSLPEEDRTLIADLLTSQIAQRYGVSDRTARNWRKLARSNDSKKI